MAGSDEPRVVRFLGVPVAAFVELQRYFDDMVRELQLIEVGRSNSGASARLRDLAIYTQHDIAADRHRLHAQAVAAAARGESTVDLELVLWPASVPDAHALVDLVAAFDRRSDDGDLLTPRSGPTERRLVEWIAAEADAQVLHGRPPTPFPAAGR